jgi:hypothetical protein
MSLRRGPIEQAEVAINDARARLHALGALGEIDGQLKAGEHVLTGSTEIVEAIKERHGFGCTISARTLSTCASCSTSGEGRGNVGEKRNGPGDRSPRPLLKSAGSRFRDPA